MQEVWKAVPGYEGRYEVSDLGHVRNVGGRVLALCTVSGGYKAVSLGRNNSKTIHRLVALAFLGPAPNEKPLVLHNDGDRTNNTLHNLRYGSHADNAADAKRHGTQVKGERQHVAKLTLDNVLAIRNSSDTGTALAAQFGVTPQCINLIRTRKNWRHV
jgi:hypothetical protein